MRSKILGWHTLGADLFEFSLDQSKLLARLAKTDLPQLEGMVDKSLVTLIPAQSEALDDVDWLQNHLQHFRALDDDVWSHAFLDGLLISTVAPPDSSAPLALGFNAQSLVPWHAAIHGIELPAGPYVLSKQSLYRVFRLYDDRQSAFMVPVKPPILSAHDSGIALLGCQPLDPERIFEPLGLADADSLSLSVAVPPKLPSLFPHDLPLAGKRFAVKEVFSIRGLRMALANRAHYAISQPAEATATVVEKLLNAGAELTGVVKCSCMASREDPAEAVDFISPFNPRGDGYQSPTDSSNGSAAAIASYEWLDFTLGTDTIGSSRRPAFVNGCFQLRFSHGALPSDGIRPAFKDFDVPALFTRSFQELESVAKVLIGPEPHQEHSKPTVVICLQDYLPVADQGQQELLDSVARDVADCFQIPIRKAWIHEMWVQSPPEDAVGKSLETYLHDAGRNSFIYDLYHNNDEFRSLYEQKYHKPPFVTKVTQWRWDVGQTITQEQRDDAVRRMQVYGDWILEKILRNSSETALVLLPIKDAEPGYRDIDPGPPAAQNAWNPLWLAPILKSPEISVPIGEVSYESRISRRSERLPVLASFLGPPGTDLMLVETLKTAFTRAGRPLDIKVGTSMYA